MNLILLYCFLFCVLLAVIRLRFSPKHLYNIKQSKLILKKIQSFEHPGAIINYLRKIDPFVFEDLILTRFKQLGFSVTRNRRYTGDGGIDGLVHWQKRFFSLHQESYLIQDKRYQSYINKQHLLEFFELVKKQNAAGGFFVSTGKTSQALLNEFRGTHIVILSGSSLVSFLTENKNPLLQG